MSGADGGESVPIAATDVEWQLEGDVLLALTKYGYAMLRTRLDEGMDERAAVFQVLSNLLMRMLLISAQSTRAELESLMLALRSRLLSSKHAMSNLRLAIDVAAPCCDCEYASAELLDEFLTGWVERQEQLCGISTWGMSAESLFEWINNRSLGTAVTVDDGPHGRNKKGG